MFVSGFLILVWALALADETIVAPVLPIAFVSQSTVLALNLMGLPAVANGGLISLGHFSLDIVAACTGITFAAMFTVAFMLVYLDLRRRSRLKLKQGLILLIVGLLGTIGLNMVRIVFTVLVGYYYGLGAMYGFHDYSGLTMFSAFVAVFWWQAMKYANRAYLKHL